MSFDRAFRVLDGQDLSDQSSVPKLADLRVEAETVLAAPPSQSPADVFAPAH
jgi:hypothetical protein